MRSIGSLVEPLDGSDWVGSGLATAASARSPNRFLADLAGRQGVTPSPHEGFGAVLQRNLTRSGERFGITVGSRLPWIKCKGKREHFIAPTEPVRSEPRGDCFLDEIVEKPL
jgi:hypothetical protein